jgi:hypothetical protein
MDLKCFVYPGWEPKIRPGAARRDWMDGSPESFAYRCLPLTIANSHGWEILNPCACEVVWNGGPAAEDVVVTPDPGASPRAVPVALFGLGTVTFHIEGIFRTPPGWNLWAGGPPNMVKDGAGPLSGVIETDWSPFTFTMNWKLTRPRHPVRFELDEPICFIFPVERKTVESVAPRFVAMGDDPALKAAFEAWSQSRDAFQARMRQHPPATPAEKWQKFYYRGTDVSGHCPITDHQSKLRAAPFEGEDLVAPRHPPPPAPPKGRPRGQISRAAASAEPSFQAAKYAWMLDTLERQRQLSTAASGVFRAEGITNQAFLDGFYALNRPLIIAGEITGWPALQKWTPDYLGAKLAGRFIEVQAGRTASAQYERRKDDHAQIMPFETFMDRITGPALEANGAQNDIYLTAYNSRANREALAPLCEDMGVLPKLLQQTDPSDGGMMWIGPGGAFTPLHHDLTNNLFVQIVGAKRFVMAPATALPNMYNDQHVFSEISDVKDPNLNLGHYPKLARVKFHEFILNPGEILFIPIGWWHQVTSLDFSVSATYTNFLWPNLGHDEHPNHPPIDSSSSPVTDYQF